MNYFKLNVTFQDVEAAALRVLAAFMKNNKSFTAYDVTQTLRQDVGTSVNVEHEVVKTIVHDVMSNNPFYIANYNYLVKDSITAIQYLPSDAWQEAKFEPNVRLNVNIPRISFSYSESSLVRGLSYSGTDEAGELTVHLDENFYTYQNVPFSIYLNVLNADSKGHAYNEYVKGQYTCTKVTS